MVNLHFTGRVIIVSFDMPWKKVNNVEYVPFFLVAPDNSKSQPPAQTSDVIINTYMRAGSSFLGKMLGFRDDTFYVYEPLWMFHRYGYYHGMREVCWAFAPGCR